MADYLTSTAQEGRRYIREGVQHSSFEEMVKAIVEWSGAEETAISMRGDIWIANPMRGHWLSSASLIEFVNQLA